jgi:hypothetical protein
VAALQASPAVGGTKSVHSAMRSASSAIGYPLGTLSPHRGPLRKSSQRERNP